MIQKAFPVSFDTKSILFLSRGTQLSECYTAPQVEPHSVYEVFANPLYARYPQFQVNFFNVPNAFKKHIRKFEDF